MPLRERVDKQWRTVSGGFSGKCKQYKEIELTLRPHGKGKFSISTSERFSGSAELLTADDLPAFLAFYPRGGCGRALNGAGKSTLLKLVAGSSEPDQG